MPLSIAQKSGIRRHLGYPTVGIAVTNAAGGSLMDGSIGYRYFQAYAFMEYKLDNFNPDEEARITGNAYGSILVQGNTQPGDTITVTLSNGPLTNPVSVTYTAGSSDTALSMAVGVANLVNQNAALLSAGFYAVAPYGTGPYAYRPGGIPLAAMSVLGTQSYTFAAAATGSTSAAVTSNGAILTPRAVLTDPFTNQVTQIYGYLPILDALETGAVGTSEDLDTLKADVWSARQDELEEREKLYKFWRMRLSKFMFVPLFEDTALDFRWEGSPGAFI